MCLCEWKCQGLKEWENFSLFAIVMQLDDASHHCGATSRHTPGAHTASAVVRKVAWQRKSWRTVLFSWKLTTHENKKFPRRMIILSDYGAKIHSKQNTPSCYAMQQSSQNSHPATLFLGDAKTKTARTMCIVLESVGFSWHHWTPEGLTGKTRVCPHPSKWSWPISPAVCWSVLCLPSTCYLELEYSTRLRRMLRSRWTGPWRSCWRWRVRSNLLEFKWGWPRLCRGWPRLTKVNRAHHMHSRTNIHTVFIIFANNVHRKKK